MKRIFELILLLLIYSHEGRSCTCIGSSTVKAGIKSSDLVVVGQVISKNTVYRNKEQREFQFEELHFRILVTTSFKGHMTLDTVTVITGFGNGDCGFQFEIGQHYIIYGRKHVQAGSGKTKELTDTFETDICTRTQPFNEQELSEIRKFRKEKKLKTNKHK